MLKPAPDANVQVVEPEHVRDDYTTDFAFIEAVGPCARFTMVVETTTPGFPEQELLVVRKLMIPIDRLQSMVDRTQAFIDDWQRGQLLRASALTH